MNLLSESKAIAVPVSEFSKNLIAGKDKSPHERLLDLSLPDEDNPDENYKRDYLDILVPVLKSLHYTLQIVEVEDIWGKKRKLHSIKKTDAMRYLLYIPDWILTNPCEENKNAVTGISNLFLPLSEKSNNGIALYFFHVSEPSPCFLLQIGKLWPKMFKISSSKFISFGQIRNLKNENDSFKVSFITDAIDLSSTAKNPYSQISYPDMNNICNVLASYPPFQDGEGSDRRNFIRSAGIGNEILENIDLNGPGKDVARNIINRIMDYEGSLPSSSGETHKLKLLCKWLSDLPDLPRSDKASIDQILNTYD